MDVVVDGTIRWVPPEGTRTFRDLFDALRRSPVDPRRVMVLVKLDGQVLSGTRQAELESQTLPSQGLLEIQTADRLGLAATTVRDLMGHLGALEKTHQEAAEQVIGANYRNAMGKFKDCFEGWRLFAEALRSVSAAARIDLSTLESSEGAVEAELRNLAESLSRFKTAFDQSDVVRLADIAQYDLKPLLGKARSALETLRRKLSEPRPGSP